MAMSDHTPKPFKIAVIGGGLAGLAVAHGLERAKKDGRAGSVQVIVYERRQEDSSFTKYPIRVSPEGREALRAILSPESFGKLLVKSDHGLVHGGISTFTERFSHLFTVERYQHEQPQFVHRWVLGEALAEGVDIRRGKRVVRIRQEDGKEKVGVVFDDGTEEHVDLVVAADGLGSIVRNQLHPSYSQVPILPYIGVQFQLLTRLAHLPSNIPHHSLSCVLGKTAYSMILVPFHGTPVPPLATIETNPFSDPSEYEPTLQALNEPCPEYIFTAFVMEAFQGYEDMTGNAWLAKIVQELKEDGADSRLIRAVEEDGVPQTVGAWQLVSMDEKDPIPWKGGRVVMIGDAAHVMPPQGGVGGSIAMKDAEELVDVLLSSGELGGTEGALDDLLPVFHEQMLHRASGHIRDAKRRLALSHKKGWGVVWQRALMRVMNLCLPLAIWILSRGRKSVERERSAALRKTI